MKHRNNGGDAVLGLWILAAITLCAIELGTIVPVLILIVGYFFGLPIIYSVFVSRTFRDPISRTLMMAVIFFAFTAFVSLLK